MEQPPISPNCCSSSMARRALENTPKNSPVFNIPPSNLSNPLAHRPFLAPHFFPSQTKSLENLMTTCLESIVNQNAKHIDEMRAITAEHNAQMLRVQEENKQFVRQIMQDSENRTLKILDLFAKFTTRTGSIDSSKESIVSLNDRKRAPSEDADEAPEVKKKGRHVKKR